MAKIGKVTKVNPVAKHSRNKSGAGAHKSKKDYDRKQIKAMDKADRVLTGIELPEESIASKLDRLVLLENMQEHCNNPSIWFSYEEEIQLIKKELQDVDF